MSSISVWRPNTSRNIGHCGIAVAIDFLLALLANAKGPQSALRQVKNPALGQKLAGVRGVLMVSQRRHVSSCRQYRHLARASLKAKPPSTPRATSASTQRFRIIRSINSYRRRNCSGVGHNSLEFDISNLPLRRVFRVDASLATLRLYAGRGVSSLRQVKLMERKAAAAHRHCPLG
jgi:hypothetical protein